MSNTRANKIEYYINIYINIYIFIFILLVYKDVEISIVQ